jgi:hypothetical protein
VYSLLYKATCLPLRGIVFLENSASWAGLACLIFFSHITLPTRSDPDDLTLVSHLMAAVATTLDRCEAARRRKVPFGIGGNKKTRDADRRQTLERVAAQRAALSASRIGLPGFVQVGWRLAYSATKLLTWASLAMPSSSC